MTLKKDNAHTQMLKKKKKYNQKVFEIIVDKVTKKSSILVGNLFIRKVAVAHAFHQKEKGSLL